MNKFFKNIFQNLRYLMCQNLTLKNQDNHWEINTYYTGSEQLYLPCLYFGPLFLSRHRLVGTVCHCCGNGHEPEAKKKKNKKNIPSALFTCTLKSNEKVIIRYMFRYLNKIFWLCVNNFFLTLQTLCFWASWGMREDSFCHLLRRPPLRLAAGDTASCGPRECPHT